MKRLTLISLVLLGAILLSACSGSSAIGASWPGLTADTNNAYLAAGQFVYAVRLSDGTKVWQYPDKGGGQVFDSNPVLTPDGQLLVGSSGNDHSLTSLDPATGQAKWPVPFTGAADRWIAPPLAVNDTVYAPNNDGSLYALKLTTGEKLWSLPISHSLWSAPVSDGKLIYLTSLDHFLYAIDPQAQKIIWKTDLGGPAPGSPVLSADGTTLYIGSFASEIFAVNTADGTIRWTSKTNDWIWGGPVLNADTLYAADINGQIYSLGVADGKNTWPMVEPDGAMTASLLLRTDGVVAATESGSLYALDHNGTKLWNATLIEAGKSGNIYTTPVASGDLILVAPYGADFLLAAVNKDGGLVWKFTGK